MTWHGPGQSVLYAICDLRPGRRVRGFVEALVGAMARRGRRPRRRAPGDDAMGLYAGGRKLGSVGIRVSGGDHHATAWPSTATPTSTGSALMTACGAPDVAATSIAAEGGDPDRARVDAALGGARCAAPGAAAGGRRRSTTLAVARGARPG